MSKILWIDDDYQWIRGLIKPLEKDGYQFDCVRTVEAAVAKLTEFDYELVLLDLLLPGLGTLPQVSLPEDVRAKLESKKTMGEGLLAFTRDVLELHVPIIVLTVVREDVELKKRLERYGVSYILRKGNLRPNMVKEVVERVLGGVDLEGPVKLNLRSQSVEMRRVGLEQAGGMGSTPALFDELREFVRTESDPGLLLLCRRILDEWERAATKGQINSTRQDGSRCDIGIIIALPEEFMQLFPQVTATPEYRSEIKQIFYSFEKKMGERATYRCVTTFVGDAGEQNAAVIADRLMREYGPAALVNIGIAGSIDSDVLLGDVVIAEQVDHYLHNAKAVSSGDSQSFKVELSGDPYKTHPDFVAHARHFQFAYALHAQRWAAQCQGRFESTFEEPVRIELRSKKWTNEPAKLHIGHIASGDIVGSATQFKDWLRDRDRKYLALEMESSGVVGAAFSRSVPVLVIRGISDMADSHKNELDKISGGALRRYAMGNALDLLWVFLELGIVEKNP